MGKLKDLKKWGWLPILLLLIVVATITTVTLVAEGSTESLFNLNERDVVLAVDESKTVELESEKVNVKSAKLAVSWKSSKPSVASVDKDGTIKAASGGETKITAVVEYKGKEYSTSCVVTVKAEGNKYSTYKIRWFTQTPDRKEYEIKEETFEREVGSKVELTELDAKKSLPSQYVLNKEKSTLRGTVKSKLGVCVLEVYFDVAEVPYTVDYYYESADKLGTYTEKETKSYKAYAFTKVGVTEGPKAGFVRNDKVKGTVLSSSSVTSGTKLKVYCDRIRSNVTINYISGRASATYTNVYGVGLVGAPADALKDSVEYYTATYVNGEKKNATMKLLQGMTKDTTVDFKLDGVGFTYSLKNGVSTITNECDEKATPCYAMLKGQSNTLYLSATYQLTGSTSNKFGITLNDGKTSREIRFKLAGNKQSGGVSIMMDNTKEGGILTAEDTTNQYDRACEHDSEVFVWALNFNTDGERVSSIVKDMLSDRDGGNYQIQWAVYEGVLYARIEDQTVLRLPLDRLNKKWNEKTEFEIGISSYDATAWNDELRVTNVNLKTGDAAKQMLKLDGQVASSDRYRMGYDVFSGSYISASKKTKAYLYGNEAVNTGISSDVKWVDINNTSSAIGVSVKVGEKSYQYIVTGMNAQVRRHEDQDWGTPVTMTKQILGKVTPFNEQGEAKIDAFVKDGYFYVLYNGVQTQCINMLNLFPEYKADTKASVGIYTWDAYNGLATFSNVKELNNEAITKVCQDNFVEEWGYYFEYHETTDNKGLNSFAKNVTYDFEQASTEPTRDDNQKTKQGTLTFMGENTAWQVEGKFERSETDKETNKRNILLGFQITSGNKKNVLVGRKNGFQQYVNNGTANNDYSDYAPSVNSFNNLSISKFFHADKTDRQQDFIGFKAVIYNDIFYVWFTDANGNTGLCWRVPLTEQEFGGFEAGSEYRIAVFFGNGSTAHATATNLKAKMGYQVTGQKNFTTDTQNKQYNFTDAIAKIEENVAKFANKSDAYYQTHNISGNLAEVTFNTHSWMYDVRNLSHDITEDKMTIDNPKAGSNTQAYFTPTDKTQVITGTFKFENPDDPAYGITVKSGNTSAQIVALIKNNNVRIQLNETWATNYKSYYVTDEVINAVPDWTHPYADNELKVTAYVNQGTMYLFFDDKLIGSVDLYQLLPGYEEGDKVQLGVYGWDVNKGPAKEVTDLTQAIGEDATAYMNQYLEAKNINLTDKYTWQLFWNNGTLSKEVANAFKYDGKLNKVTSFGKDVNRVLWSAPTSMTQKLEATVHAVDKTKTSTWGFQIQTGGKNVRIMIRMSNAVLTLLKDDVEWKDRVRWNAEDSSTMTGLTYKETQSSYKMSALVKDGALYIYYGKDTSAHPTLVSYMKLTDLNPQYEKGDDVTLGLHSYDASLGLAYFDNISFTAGTKAEQRIPDSDALKTILTDRKKDWGQYIK